MSYSLAQALRYLMSGGVIMSLYWYLFCQSGLEDFLKGMKSVVIIGIALVAGVLAYNIYRALLYTWLIPCLQDCVRRHVFRSRIYSFRTYLKVSYPKLRHREAILLHDSICRVLTDKEEPGGPVEFAAAHFVYMSGILVFIAGILVFVAQAGILALPIACSYHSGWGLVLLGLALFVIGFGYDHHCESHEFAVFFPHLEERVCDDIASRLFHVTRQPLEQRAKAGYTCCLWLIVLVAVFCFGFLCGFCSGKFLQSAGRFD